MIFNMKTDLKTFFKRFYQKALFEEDVLSTAAQVAFYFSFALFPLLLFLVSLFGIILESADAFRNELFYYLRQIMPYSAFDLVRTTISEVTQNSSSKKLTAGLLIALWSASAGVDSLRIALNSVYNLEEKRSWFKTKLLALFLTFSLTVLVTIACAIVFYGWKFFSLILTAASLPSPSPVFLMIFQWIVVLAVLLVIFAIIYNYLPMHEPHRWVWISPGSVTGIILWLTLSYAFRTYLSYFNTYDKTYGSLGAVIILLLWLYLTALVILVGGIINAVLQELTDPETAAKSIEQSEIKLEKAKADHASYEIEKLLEETKQIEREREEESEGEEESKGEEESER
jgi:membrane protein